MNMPETREALIAAVSAGTAFEFVPFFRHEHPFSQWHPAPFTVSGQRYATAEQWMMAEKARTFGDWEGRRRILATPYPAEAKALGRTVRGFDEVQWATERLNVVFNGNLQKFKQNPHLFEKLLATAGQVLVEASPRDLVWGAGVSTSDPTVAHPESWPGLNLLGFTLMRVRYALATGG